MKTRAQIALGTLGALLMAACSDPAAQQGDLGQQSQGPDATNPTPTVPGVLDPNPSGTVPGVGPNPVDGPNPTVSPNIPNPTPSDTNTPVPVDPNPQPTPNPDGTGGTPNTPGDVECSNTDMTVIPIDETGWVPAQCNAYAMQGAWYCYDDGINPSGCVADTPPYRAGGGMCLSGSTTIDETFAAWGAGIGFSLNDSGESDTMASVKGPYDAATNGILGFTITITGDSGGLPIRVNFANEAAPAGVSPFVEVPGAGTYDVMIADALVPEAWMIPESGTAANASALYDVQIQIVGGETAAAYDICVSSLVPISDGTVVPSPNPTPNPGGTLANYGSAVCDNFATINLGNAYMVQNNSYNGATHCIQAKWDNGSNAGFSLSGVSANAPSGGAPASYPSLVYGWHVDGQFYGGYTSARQISAIGSAPTTFNVTVPGAGRYNAAYDNWINSGPTAGSDQGTLEQMIWTNFRDTTPIGSSVGTVMLAGTTWEVWYGPNEGFNTVTYKRVTNTDSISFDLKEFLDDTVSRGYAAGNHYLLGIQAGFEIWEANQTFSVDSFSASVN